MNYIELSIKDLKETNKKLVSKVNESNIKFDLVIFVAKGSYLIGKGISDELKLPLLEVIASRKGGKLKSIIKPLLKIVPKFITKKLREKEMNSSYHVVNSERKISYKTELFQKYKHCKNILLVDDSIDSGYSVLLIKEELERFFKDGSIKIAVYNYMNKSIIKPDYTLYNDTMICGPWSNDSKYNKEHLKQYMEWKCVYEKEN